MEIRPVGAELFRANRKTHRRTDGKMDTQTEITKLIITFRNFSKAPQNYLNFHFLICLHAMPKDKFKFFIFTNYVMNHCFRHLGESLN